MNVLDRIVSYVSPETGVRRQGARNALGVMRSYAGAQLSRGRDGFNIRSTSADAEIGPSMVRLRNTASQQVRDNPIAKRCVDLWKLHIVGDGINVYFTGKSDVRKQTRWEKWWGSNQCDADGRLDGAGLQALAVGIMIERGGVLVRKVWRDTTKKKWRHLSMPFQIQVLEPDFIDHAKNGPSDIEGNVIVQGIEFDSSGTVYGYWLWPQHPGERSVFPTLGVSSTRVSASEVKYMFRKERSPQIHGVTWFHPVLNTLRDLDEYFESLAMKAKIEACYAILIESDDHQAPPGQTQKASSGNDFEVEPGLVRRLRKGETAKAFDPSNSSGHNMLAQSFIRMIAIGMGLTYDQAYSDLTGANYSSLRAGKLEFNGLVNSYQWQIVIPQMMEPIVDWFVDAGVIAHFWSSGRYEIDIQPPPKAQVDPSKDGKAEILDIENGLSTWSQRVRARGYNPEKQRQELAQEVKAFEDDGLEHPYARQRKPGKADAKAAKAAVQRNLEELGEAA